MGTSTYSAVIDELLAEWPLDQVSFKTVYLRLIKTPGGPPGVFRSQEKAEAALTDKPAFYEAVQAAFQKTQGVNVKVGFVSHNGRPPSFEIMRK